MVGVTLEDGHHEGKALEIVKRQHGIEFEMKLPATRDFASARKGGKRR